MWVIAEKCIKSLHVHFSLFPTPPHSKGRPPSHPSNMSCKYYDNVRHQFSEGRMMIDSACLFAVKVSIYQADQLSLAAQSLFVIWAKRSWGHNSDILHWLLIRKTHTNPDTNICPISHFKYVLSLQNHSECITFVVLVSDSISSWSIFFSPSSFFQLVCQFMSGCADDLAEAKKKGLRWNRSHEHFLHRRLTVESCKFTFVNCLVYTGAVTDVCSL